MNESELQSGAQYDLLLHDGMFEAVDSCLQSIEQKYQQYSAENQHNKVFYYRPLVSHDSQILVIIRTEDDASKAVQFHVEKIDLTAGSNVKPEPIQVLGVSVVTRNNDVILVLAAPDDPSPLFEKHGVSLPDQAKDVGAAWADVDGNYRAWQERNSLFVSGPLSENAATFKGRSLQYLSEVEKRLKP